MTSEEFKALSEKFDALITAIQVDGAKTRRVIKETKKDKE